MSSSPLLPVVKDAAVTASKHVIKTVVGSEPPTCPFRIFDDPFVQDVLALDTLIAEGGEAFVDLDVVPLRVIEGRAQFRVALLRARNERLARELEERKAQAEEARRRAEQRTD